MLPPGTLAALKGHFHGIVTVVALAVVVGSMAAGAPPQWAVLALVIALLMYHVRCRDKEHHEENMAQSKINEAMVRVEAVKARHRDLLSVKQPTLNLEDRPVQPPRRRGGT
jgi:hypothetical protein